MEPRPEPKDILDGLKQGDASEIISDLVAAYVDALADGWIREGFSHYRSRIFSTVLGEYLFHDLVTNLKWSEIASYEELVSILKRSLDEHPLTPIVVSFFDPLLEQVLACMVESHEPQRAVERAAQFQQQTISTFNEQSETLSDREWPNAVAEFAKLDRLWFQYNCMKANLGVGEACSDRLRRYIFNALEQMRQIDRLIATPVGMAIGRQAVKNYSQKMAAKGLSDPFKGRRKKKGPEKKGFGR